MDNQCLYCGNYYMDGLEGCCRSCWEKNQFSQQEYQTDVDILNGLQNKVEAAGDLLESISMWLWKIQGLQPEPMWVDQFKSVCTLFDKGSE